MKKRAYLILPAVLIIVLAAVFTIASNGREAEYKPPVVKQSSQQAPTVTPETLLEELNSRRAAIGVPALTLDEDLNRSAQAKCDEMHEQNYYGHINPTTGLNGYKLAEGELELPGRYSENLIGRVHKNNDPKLIFSSWFGSQEHKDAALDSRYKLTGFGYCLPAVTQAGDSYRTIVEHFYSPQSF